MSKLKLIVCLGKDNIIGEVNPVGNGLLWHSKEELTFFKEKTVGNVVLTGKTTARVMPVELMRKNRDVIILERNTNIEELLRKYENSDKTIYICGGLTIYKYFLENYNIDQLLISKLKESVEIKSTETPLYFPNVEEYGYSLVEKDEKHHDFIVEIYERQNKK